MRSLSADQQKDQLRRVPRAQVTDAQPRVGACHPRSCDQIRISSECTRVISACQRRWPSKIGSERTTRHNAAGRRAWVRLSPYRSIGPSSGASTSIDG